MKDGLVSRASVWIFLIAVSALIVLPFIADYFILVLGISGLLYGAVRRDGALVSAPAIMIYVAICLLLVTVPFVFRGMADLVPSGAAALLLVAPGIAVILMAGARYVSPLVFHISCLVAAMLGVTAGGIEYFLTLNDRVGLGNNPIHYAALSVLLGFLAVPGVAATSSKLRFVFLLGPVFGLTAVLLSGSRGPFLVAVMLTLLAVVLLAIWYRRDRGLMIALVGALGLAALATILFGLFMPGRAMSIMVTLRDVVMSGSGAIDAYRQAMYGTAFSALQMSPFFGIGFGQIMPHIVEANPDLTEMRTLQDLHSDFANFTAAAGIPGLLAYCLMVAAPLLLWQRGQPALNMTLVLLAAGQFCLGLTNTTFGILPQTMLYGAALGYCMAARLSSQFGFGDSAAFVRTSGQTLDLQTQFSGVDSPKGQAR